GLDTRILLVLRGDLRLGDYLAVAAGLQGREFEFQQSLVALVANGDAGGTGRGHAEVDGKGLRERGAGQHGCRQCLFERLPTGHSGGQRRVEVGDVGEQFHVGFKRTAEQEAVAGTGEGLRTTPADAQGVAEAGRGIDDARLDEYLAHRDVEACKETTYIVDY